VRKIIPGVASVAAVLALSVCTKPVTAWAAKVDCTKVMSELNSGKKVADVADDLQISTSSVYRCRRRAKKATAKAKASPTAAAAFSPMASPSPSH
jgi:hypothetical protein